MCEFCLQASDYFQIQHKNESGPKTPFLKSFCNGLDQGWGMEKKANHSNSNTFIAPKFNSYTNSYTPKAKYLFQFQVYQYVWKKL